MLRISSGRCSTISVLLAIAVSFLPQTCPPQDANDAEDLIQSWDVSFIQMPVLPATIPPERSSFEMPAKRSHGAELAVLLERLNEELQAVRETDNQAEKQSHGVLHRLESWARIYAGPVFASSAAWSKSSLSRVSLLVANARAAVLGTLGLSHGGPTSLIWLPIPIFCLCAAGIAFGVWRMQESEEDDKSTRRLLRARDVSFRRASWNVAEAPKVPKLHLPVGACFPGVSQEEKSFFRDIASRGSRQPVSNIYFPYSQPSTFVSSDSDILAPQRLIPVVDCTPLTSELVLPPAPELYYAVPLHILSAIESGDFDIIGSSGSFIARANIRQMSEGKFLQILPSGQGTASSRGARVGPMTQTGLQVTGLDGGFSGHLLPLVSGSYTLSKGHPPEAVLSILGDHVRRWVSVSSSGPLPALLATASVQSLAVEGDDVEHLELKILPGSHGLDSTLIVACVLAIFVLGSPVSAA